MPQQAPYLVFQRFGQPSDRLHCVQLAVAFDQQASVTATAESHAFLDFLHRFLVG